MAIAKKSLVILLALVLIVLGLELAVQSFSDFKIFRTRIATELAARLQADVEIDRMGLDVLPWPHLELRAVRVGFPDGSLLRVPVVNLSPTLKGLFAGRPEVVSISLEKPEAQIVMRAQEAESVVLAQKARLKEQAAYIHSLLQAIPSGITVQDGSVRVAALDGNTLVFEDVDAKIEVTLRGVRVFAECTSALWKNLGITLTYHDPAVTLNVDALNVDTVKSIRALKAFAGEVLPDIAITKNLSGMLSTVSFTVRIANVSDPLNNADINGGGSFEDMSIDLQEDLDVRELDGDFELKGGNISATGISARLGNSRIHKGAFNLDRSRGFAPSLITAEFNIDLSDVSVPGLLHLIPDPDVRSEIELIKDPRGTAVGTFALRAEGDSYSAEIAVKKLLLQASYRAFPSTFELRQGTCSYRDEVLSFDKFSGKFGSSMLPDFSLSFSIQGGPDDFTAAAKGAMVDFVDLRMVLDSFDDSKEFIENITHAEGSAKIESLTLKGPLADPERWTIAVDARLDDVSITSGALDGPLVIKSGVLKADQKACTLSQADITYLDAKLSGSLTLNGYFDDIQTATADFSGTMGEKALDGIQGLIEAPDVLALRPPVKIERSRLEWSHDGAVSVAGDFVLGLKTKVGLKLRSDSSAFEIKELAIRDAESQCTLGIEIKEDIFSFSYTGVLRKDTLDRVLLDNSFLQGWLEGDISAQFNQKNPRLSSAKGKLAWEKAGFPALDSMPITLTSAEMTARDKLLTVGSAGLSAGLDSAGVQGSINFTDEGFVLDLALEAESIDIDAIMDRISGDNASEGSSADEFWETPLRGTLRLKAQELKKDSIVCKPFKAFVTFADRAVTINTEGTRMCAVALPATVRITPDDITLDMQARAEKSPVKEFTLCLYGGDGFITGTFDMDGSVQGQAAPDALLDSLDGNFTISARDGRIYRSGLIAKIISFLSIRNLLKLSVRDMARNGYAYQILDIEGTVKGQNLEIERTVLISTAFTLVFRGIIDLKGETVDIDALVTPFQIHNQVLSKVPLVGGWLSKPMLGIPVKMRGPIRDPRIRTRTTSAATKGLMDITKGIIKAPIRLFKPVSRRKPPEEQ